MLRQLAADSVSLVVTSPPFALIRQKAYGNVAADEYIEWFWPFAEEIHRVLRPDGSFVLELGGAWNSGSPTRSLYQYELIIRLCKMFHLAQDFYWFNPSRLPTPAEWVTIRRTRVKDAVNPIWWLSKTENPQADNRQVLKPYSKSMKRLLAGRLRRGDAAEPARDRPALRPRQRRRHPAEPDERAEHAVERRVPAPAARRPGSPRTRPGSRRRCRSSSSAS